MTPTAPRADDAEARAAQASKEISDAMYSGGNPYITTPIITAAIRSAVLAEKERCARICEDRIAKYDERIEFAQSLGETGPWVEQDWAFEAGAIAIRIRADAIQARAAQPEGGEA